MYDSNYIKATDIPAQTNFYNEVKIKKMKKIDSLSLMNPQLMIRKKI